MYLSIHSTQHARPWCNKLTKKFVEQTSQAIAQHIGIISERIYSKVMHTAKAVPFFASLERKTLRHDTLNKKDIPQHHEQPHPLASWEQKNPPPGILSERSESKDLLSFSHKKEQVFLPPFFYFTIYPKLFNISFLNSKFDR